METTKFMPFSLECDSLLESALKKIPVEGKRKKKKKQDWAEGKGGGHS